MKSPFIGTQSFFIRHRSERGRGVAEVSRAYSLGGVLVLLVLFMMSLSLGCGEDGTTSPTLGNTAGFEPGLVDLGLDGQQVMHLDLDGSYLYAAATSAGLLRLDVGNPKAEWAVLGFNDVVVLTKNHGVYDVMVQDDGTILAALNTGMKQGAALYRSTDGGASWERWDKGIYNEGIGYSGNVECLSSAPPGDGTLFAARLGVYRSDDDGESWSLVLGNPADPGPSFSAVVCHPSDPSVVWAGGQSGGIVPWLMVSRDGGGTWNNISGQVRARSGTVVSFAVDPVDPQAAYAGGQYGGMLRTEDGGATWVQCAGPNLTTTPSRNAFVGAIESDYSTPGHLFFSGYDILYESWDGARTVKVLDCTAPDIVRDILYDKTHSALYVATRDGVIRYIPE